MKEINEEESKKKFDIRKLNEVLRLSGKILKIVYILIIIVALYAATLVIKEWEIFGFLVVLLKVLAPFFIGIVIAWLLEPVIKYLHEKKINRILGTLLVYVILLSIIYLVFNTMIPLLLEQINEFIQTLPTILDDILKWFNNIFKGLKSTDYINFESIKAESIDSIQEVVGNITTKLPTMFVNMIKSIFAAFGVFILGLMIGLYLLFDFDNAGKLIFSVVPKKYRNDLRGLFIEINTSLFGFVKGTLITSTLVFVLSSIVFSIVGLKAPLLFGLICGVTNIIPYVGPYLGAIPAVIVAFSQSTSIGLFVSITLMVIQTIEGNFINPLVMSKTMKLHPVTILISLLIFEHFFGIIGMIVATPVVAAIKVIVSFFNKKYHFYKNSKKEAEE